jgi:hypothetical protein
LFVSVLPSLSKKKSKKDEDEDPIEKFDGRHTTISREFIESLNDNIKSNKSLANSLQLKYMLLCKIWTKRITACYLIIETEIELRCSRNEMNFSFLDKNWISKVLLFEQSGDLGLIGNYDYINTLEFHHPKISNKLSTLNRLAELQSTEILRNLQTMFKYGFLKWQFELISTFVSSILVDDKQIDTIKRFIQCKANAWHTNDSLELPPILVELISNLSSINQLYISGSVYQKVLNNLNAHQLLHMILKLRSLYSSCLNRTWDLVFLPKSRKRIQFISIDSRAFTCISRLWLSGHQHVSFGDVFNLKDIQTNNVFGGTIRTNGVKVCFEYKNTARLKSIVRYPFAHPYEFTSFNGIYHVAIHLRMIFIIIVQISNIFEYENL